MSPAMLWRILISLNQATNKNFGIHTLVPASVDDTMTETPKS